MPVQLFPRSPLHSPAKPGEQTLSPWGVDPDEGRNHQSISNPLQSLYILVPNQQDRAGCSGIHPHPRIEYGTVSGPLVSRRLVLVPNLECGRMDMAIERLTECIGRAVQQAEFTNVYKRRFDSPEMHELYARKMRREYVLSNTDAIDVSETELTDLASEITPMVAKYTSRETGAIGNGFYKMLGSQASPRLPSVEDYAKLLVLAAARVGSERVAGLFTEWVEGRPIRVWLCALLKGVRTDGKLRTVDGLCLDTLPSNGNEFPRSLLVQIDEHDIRNEQYSQRAILSLEHEVGPALYSLESKITSFPELAPSPAIRNPELSEVSMNGLCRAMSVQVNSYVGWFRQWWDYGDVDAFFLNPGHSHAWRDISNSSPSLVSQEQMARCLELHKLLNPFSNLDLGIARWRRSKRVTTKEEQLVDLRIAMESILLADDKGAVGEKRHRLAIRGAWLLGKTLEERKKYFRSLQKAYDFASSVIHAGSLKKKDEEVRDKVLDEAQDICRAAILRIAKAKAMPNWTDTILGKEFHRRPEGPEK